MGQWDTFHVTLISQFERESEREFLLQCFIHCWDNLDRPDIHLEQLNKLINRLDGDTKVKIALVKILVAKVVIDSSVTT